MGQIVGAYQDGGGFHGFLLSGGSYTTLDDSLATGGTTASGINDAGQIVGTYTDASGTHGFLLSNGSYTTLDDPVALAGTTAAFGINDSGQITGSYTDSIGHVHGFLLSGGTYTTLDDPSAGNITRAAGINDMGQIVGHYSSVSGNHRFLLTIAPNPAPPAGTTASMILRGSNASPAVAGQYEIYNIGNNAILAGYQLGQVGTDWQFNGLGGVGGGNTTMLLRNAGTGGFELYGVSNNIVSAAFLGTVGLDWQFAGFGDFSSRGESDMILRNGNTGALQVVVAPEGPDTVRVLHELR